MGVGQGGGGISAGCGVDIVTGKCGQLTLAAPSSIPTKPLRKIFDTSIVSGKSLILTHSLGKIFDIKTASRENL